MYNFVVLLLIINYYMTNKLLKLSSIYKLLPLYLLKFIVFFKWYEGECGCDNSITWLLFYLWESWNKTIVDALLRFSW